MEGSKEMKCSCGAIVLTFRKRQSAFAFQRGKTILIHRFWLSNLCHRRSTLRPFILEKISRGFI